MAESPPPPFVTSLSPPRPLQCRGGVSLPNGSQGTDPRRDCKPCAGRGSCRSWEHWACSLSCLRLGSSGPDSWWPDPACCQADAREAACRGLLLRQRPLAGEGAEGARAVGCRDLQEYQCGLWETSRPRSIPVALRRCSASSPGALVVLKMDFVDGDQSNCTKGWRSFQPRNGCQPFTEIAWFCCSSAPLHLELPGSARRQPQQQGEGDTMQRGGVQAGRQAGLPAAGALLRTASASAAVPSAGTAVP